MRGRYLKVIFGAICAGLLVGCSGSGGPIAAAGTSLDACGLTSGQTGIKVCSFVATPTVSESVTIKNYGPGAQTLTGWTLWDANALANGTGSKSLTSYALNADESVTIGGLPFGVNDSGETITVRDGTGATVHQRSN